MKPYLQNIYNRLRSGEDTTIAFLGGSVTDGFGSSQAEVTAWRSRVTTYLRERFPQTAIRSLNAGNGGTGCAWASLRTETHVLTVHPDLVFVDCFVNDCYQEEQPESVRRNMEVIFRKIRQENPLTDIVLIYVTERGLNGNTHPLREAEDEIAVYYEVPPVDIGACLAKKVAETGGDWDVYLQDWVHPNDTGYGVYGEAVIDFLREQEELCRALPVQKHTVPVLLTECDYFHARVRHGHQLSLKGSCEGWSAVHRFDSYIQSSETAGSVLTCKVHGHFVGLMYNLTSDGADLMRCDVDGQTVELVMHPPVDKPNMANQWPKVLFRNLSDGWHDLTITNVSGGRCEIQAVIDEEDV